MRQPERALYAIQAFGGDFLKVAVKKLLARGNLYRKFRGNPFEMPNNSF